MGLWFWNYNYWIGVNNPTEAITPITLYPAEVCAPF